MIAELLAIGFYVAGGLHWARSAANVARRDGLRWEQVVLVLLWPAVSIVGAFEGDED